MYIDDGNILSTGPSYNLVSRSLRSRYEECLNWLLKAGLSIESEKTEVIFYSPNKPRPDTHGRRPDSIVLPAPGQNEISIPSLNNVRYLGLYINHKLNWHQHVNIMANQTHGSLKVLQLLSNLIRGLNLGNWRLTYNAICLPVLTYGSPIWYNSQKGLSNTLQQVQDLAV